MKITVKTYITKKGTPFQKWTASIDAAAKEGATNRPLTLGADAPKWCDVRLAKSLGERPQLEDGTYNVVLGEKLAAFFKEGEKGVTLWLYAPKASEIVTKEEGE